MSLPSSRILPPSGRSKPAIRRSVVVLPHPEGPSSEKNSPAWTAVDPVDGDDLPEALPQPDEVDRAVPPSCTRHTSSAAIS